MRKAVLAALTVAALGVSACSSGGSGSSGSTESNGTAQGPLRILITTSLTSSGISANDQTEVQAAKAAVDIVNKAGGVNGKPVEIEQVDIAGDPTTAVTKLQQKWNGANKPAIYLQVGASLIASATLPVATQAKVVSFNQSPFAGSDDPSKFPYNFDLSPSPKDYASAFCPQMKKMNAKSFAIIYNDTPFAQSNMDQVDQQCTAAGLQLVGKEKFKVDTLDVTPQLSALQSKKPDVLVVSSYGAPSGYVIQGREKLGWNVPVLGDNAFMVSPVINTAPPKGMLGTPALKDVQAEVFRSTVYNKDQPATLNEMIKGMKAQGNILAPLIVAYMFDGVMLAVAGAKAAGTNTDAVKIAKAIESLKPGAAKTAIFDQYHFSSSSHAANEPANAFLFSPVTKVVDGQFGH